MRISLRQVFVFLFLFVSSTNFAQDTNAVFKWNVTSKKISDKIYEYEVQVGYRQLLHAFSYFDTLKDQLFARANSMPIPDKFFYHWPQDDYFQLNRSL